MTTGNGHQAPPQAQQITVNMTVLKQHPNGAKIAFVGSNGMYLGAVEFESTNAEALKIISRMFADFAAQSTSGIQVVGAGAGPPGLKI